MYKYKEQKDYYNKNLLEACQIIHMSKTGASDPLSYDEMDCFREILENKLDNWYVVLNKDVEEYDNAVKHLCECALKDCEKQLLYINGCLFRNISKTIDILTKELEENVQEET